MGHAKEALTEFKRYKGLMGKEMPKVMELLDNLFQTTLAEGALTTKEKELIVIGIAIAVHCESCILVHVEKALMAGATRGEILEACGIAIAMGGGPAMTCVPYVLKYLEENAAK